MITDELVKESTLLERYLMKHGRENLIQELRALNPEQLKKKMQEYAMYRQDILDCRTNDKALNECKAQKSLLEAPHRENLTMNDKISRFINLVLKDKAE